MRLFRWFCFFVIVVCSHSSYSQDIAQTLAAKTFEMHGGLNTTLSWYAADGRSQRADPFFWNLNANLNFRIYGIDIPFTASFSKQNSKYTHPFNVYGISPTYKGVTVHLGYRSMQFSQYTLSGLTFLGVGVEIKPKDVGWEFATMVGRFDRDIPLNIPIGASELKPKFHRLGYGVKGAYELKSQRIELTIFKAQDDIQSLDTSVTRKYQLLPEDNLVVGLNTKHKLFGNLDLAFEMAVSMLTLDSQAPDRQFTGYTYANNLGVLFRPKESSTVTKVFGTTLGYSVGVYSIGISFRQVDPEYRSLGSPFVNNDYREYAANGSVSVLKQKVNISSNLGFQETNLRGDGKTSSTRVVGSGSISATITPDIQSSVSYSNFSSVSMPSAINFIDTVKYMQVNSAYNFTTSYNFGQGGIKNGVNLSLGYNLANDNYKTPTTRNNSDTKVSNANIGYQLTHNVSGFSTNIGVSFTRMQMEKMNNESQGLQLGISQPFFKKMLKANLSSSYARTKTNGIDDGAVSMATLSFSVTVMKKHSIRLNNNLLYRVQYLQQAEQAQSKNKYSSEYRGSFTYSFNF